MIQSNEQIEMVKENVCTKLVPLLMKNTLVTLTLIIAESKTKEKNIMNKVCQERKQIKYATCRLNSRISQEI